MNARVRLYSRPDCPLCDEAAALLDDLGPVLGFEVERVDISADARLEREYRWAIPVVVVDGGEVARAPIRAAALEAAMREALALH